MEVGGVPEDVKFEKRAPNDADDAGPRGLHHQHHWGSVSPIWRYQAATIYQAAAILFFRVLHDGFWLAPGGVKLKMTTSGPNPWFWAQNHGFGPDVVTFGVNPSKTTKDDLIWPKPRFWAREPGFGPDVVILGVLGGNPTKYAACVARPWAQPLKYYNPYYGDPQKGTPNFGNPPN